MHPVTIIEWDEPTHSPVILPNWLWLLLTSAAVVALGIGIWKSDSSMYMAAGAATLIAISLFAQRRSIPRSHHVVLNESALTAGLKTYTTAQIAGFWFSDDNSFPAVSFILRGNALPISFGYNIPTSTLREGLLEIIPEVIAPKRIPRHLENWLRI